MPSRRRRPRDLLAEIRDELERAHALYRLSASQLASDQIQIARLEAKLAQIQSRIEELQKMLEESAGV